MRTTCWRKAVTRTTITPRYTFRPRKRTDGGVLRLRNLRHERDGSPIEEGCRCPACQRSRGYLRHLFMAGEMLGPILLSIHNITFFQRLMSKARAAIAKDQFEAFVCDKLSKWRCADKLDDS